MRTVGARLGSAGLYLGALGLCAQAILPLLWMLSTSLKLPRDYYTSPPVLVPTEVTTSHYAGLFADYGAGQYYRNTLVIAIVGDVAGV